MKGVFLSFGLLIVSVFILSACGNVEAVQHVEVYMIETLEEKDEGIYKTTGYKKVNAITRIEESENHMETDSKERREEIQEPSTMLILNESMEKFNMDDMTKEEEEKVEEHVLSLMDLL